MKINGLKKEVAYINKMLPRNGLVELTFGNASAIDRLSGLIAIKPSGVDFKDITQDNIVVTDINGRVIGGEMKPSSDLFTHLEIYKNFKDVGGVIHTHSTNASSFSQAYIPLKCYGTTHADYFYGTIPIINLSDDEIRDNYELNTGRAIVRYFREKKIDPIYMPACLIMGHGPFVWGGSIGEALENAIALEKSAEMALKTISLNPNHSGINQALLDKHFLRKHGKNAYYGQKK